MKTKIIQDEIIIARLQIKQKIKNFIEKNCIDGIVYLTLDDFNEFIKGV